MEIKLIKESVSEIASDLEVERIELNLQRLKKSNFMFPIKTKELFDIYLFYKILEEKHKKDLFELRLKAAQDETLSINSKLSEIKEEITSNMMNLVKIKETIMNQIKESGLDFNFDDQIKTLFQALKNEQTDSRLTNRKRMEIYEKKTGVLNNIKEVCEFLEPEV